MSQKQPCQYLPWDSEFFGFRIARVKGHTLDKGKLKWIADWCKQHQIECLYFLAASNHFETIRLAEEDGYHQVDIRTTLQRDLSHWDANPIQPGDTPARIRPADQDDLPALIAIARNSYGLSRFYFDPCFSDQASAALYEAWIRKSTQGYADIVLVAEQEGGVVGYITGNVPPIDSPPNSPGDIGLTGIDPRARDQGIGSALTFQILNWFSRKGVRRVNVVTQGRNIAAQRLYQRAGFLTHSIQLWYHKWLIGCKAGDHDERV